jgi:hypothetical protein
MSTFFDEFVSGKLESTFWHLVLLSAAIIGDVLVAGGVILESWPPKDTKAKVGLGLVFFGVIISAAFTVFLFVFDEGISGNQLAKIEALELRLLERKLTPQQLDDLTALARRHPKMPLIVDTYPFAPEPKGLADSIQHSLEAGSWITVAASFPFEVVVGVIVIPAQDASPDERAAANELVSALKDTDAKAVLGKPQAVAAIPRAAIEIVVGLKQ